MRLHELEMDILRLHNRLSLRVTLEDARAIGERLIEAKALMRHGEWYPWLARLGLKPRLAQLYMQVAREDPVQGTVGLTRFLNIIRQANKGAAKARVADQRALAVETDARSVANYKVVAADCRNYDWPAVADAVCTDPRWDDLSAYRWLAGFARTHLKPGGLLVVQGSQYRWARQMKALAVPGLQYCWTLALVYAELHLSKNMFGPFQCCWRPIMVYCNGRLPRMRLQAVSDVQTVGCSAKQYHDWEQPLPPWIYWLERLTVPGELIVDPYCGSGTIGVALKTIGVRRYIGTDIDPVNVKVARARLRGETKEKQ
jgi:hypothetical protein